MPRTERSGFGRATRVALVGLVALGIGVSVAPRARAQGGVLLQGIVDVEGWSTNAKSNLLTRGDGHAAGLGRLTAWGAYEPFSKIVLYAEGEVESGNATHDRETDVYSHQYGVRYSASRLVVLDLGRTTPIIGTFAPRHYSTRNPLIGEPDGYTIDYPLAIKLSGEATHFDYRAALVSLPTSHDTYQPEPTGRLRIVDPDDVELLRERDGVGAEIQPERDRPTPVPRTIPGIHRRFIEDCLRVLLAKLQRVAVAALAFGDDDVRAHDVGHRRVEIVERWGGVDEAVAACVVGVEAVIERGEKAQRRLQAVAYRRVRTLRRL